MVAAQPYVFSIEPPLQKTSEEPKTEIPQEQKIVQDMEEKISELQQRQKEIQSEIEARLQDAETETRAMMTRAEQEGQEMMRQKQKEGFEKGKREGTEAGRKELAAALIRAKDIEKEMKKKAAEMMTALEPEIVRLILAIAKKVIHTEITMNTNVVFSVVKQAVKKVTDKTKMTVKINPQDYEVLQSQRQELLKLNSEIEELVITEDERILSGGCIIESPLDTVNSQIESQFQEIMQAFSEIAGAEVHDGNA